MKKQSVTFSAPEMKITRFDNFDVIATSFGGVPTKVSQALFGKLGAVNTGTQDASYWS